MKLLPLFFSNGLKTKIYILHSWRLVDDFIPLSVVNTELYTYRFICIRNRQFSCGYARVKICIVILS